MHHWFEVLDTRHERLLSVVGASRAEFTRGSPLPLPPARLQELNDVLMAFLQTQTALTGTGEQAQADGYYAMTVFPEFPHQATEDATAFTEAAGQYLAQARHPGSGQIVGLGPLRDLIPKAVELVGLSGPQAIAATLAATVVLDTLESINVMQEKLGGIQRSLDALHTRMDAQDDGKLSAALKDARRIQQELMEPGLTAEDRREARQSITASLSLIQAILDQDKKLAQELVRPRTQDKAGRRFPVPPQLPVALQPPVRRRVEQVNDDTLPLFSRLLRAFIVKAHLLSTLGLTELRRGLQQRENELRMELEEVQSLHREYRRIWAQNENTVREYGVNVNAQFEVAEQLERLSRELERLQQRPRTKRTLVLHVGGNGQVVEVASLPAPKNG